VGFRYTARSVAHRYAVTGYVKNITDGSVEVLAEGDQEEVRSFLADLEEQMRGHIARREVAWGEASGAFEGFAVRF